MEQKQALEEDIKAYKKLAKAKNNEEVKEFFRHQIDVVTQKMIWAFTTGKDGDNIKNWDDFCKIKGEIVARLEPIQSVYSAEQMANHLEEQVKRYYTESN